MGGVLGLLSREAAIVYGPHHAVEPLVDQARYGVSATFGSRSVTTVLRCAPRTVIARNSRSGLMTTTIGCTLQLSRALGIVSGNTLRSPLTTRLLDRRSLRLHARRFFSRVLPTQEALPRANFIAHRRTRLISGNATALRRKGFALSRRTLTAMHRVIPNARPLSVLRVFFHHDARFAFPVRFCTAEASDTSTTYGTSTSLEKHNFLV